MHDLTRAIDVLTCEMHEEKKAHRALERAEHTHQTNMGSEKLLARIESLKVAIRILTGHHQETPNAQG